jgi:hypothetical protein
MKDLQQKTQGVEVWSNSTSSWRAGALCWIRSLLVVRVVGIVHFHHLLVRAGRSNCERCPCFTAYLTIDCIYLWVHVALYHKALKLPHYYAFSDSPIKYSKAQQKHSSSRVSRSWP